MTYRFASFLFVGVAISVPAMAVTSAWSQDSSLSIRNDFDADRAGWQIYDYAESVAQGGANVFYPATWESTGGIGNSGYVWGDESRWSIDTPEAPHSILAFITYREWVGGGPVDLRDAMMSVYLRGDELDLKVGNVYFWVLGQNKTTRWHLTGSPLEITDGDWGTQQNVVLANDESLWHRSWAWQNNPASLDQVLASADSYGFSFLYFAEEVTGRFSMDEFQITAVPEPTGLIPLSLGMTVLWGVRRRVRARKTTGHGACQEVVFRDIGGRSAFTLVELLVVIAIIGVLVALLLPAVQAAREAARRAQCSNNAKQIGLALHNYISAMRTLPMGELDLPGFSAQSSIAWTGYCWATALLPFMEETGLYEQLDLSSPGYAIPLMGSAQHQRALCTPVSTFICPSSSRPATLNFSAAAAPGEVSPNAMTIMEFVGIAGSDRYGAPFGWPSKDGVFYFKSQVRMRHISDGTSNTLAIGEYSGMCPGQKLGGYSSLRDNDTTWALGRWSLSGPNSGDEFATWSVRTVAHPPNGPYYYKSSSEPGDPPIDQRVTRASLKSNHPGGLHATFVDGSVHFLSDDVDLQVIKNLADKADGNVDAQF